MGEHFSDGGYSLDGWRRHTAFDGYDRDAAIDPRVYPPPVIPAVYHNHLVLDVAQANNAESDNVLAWEIDLVRPPQDPVTAGTGAVFRLTLYPFWVPTPAVPAATTLSEYWVGWSGINARYNGHANPSAHPQFPCEVQETDDRRTKLKPLAPVFVVPQPVSLGPGRLTISTPGSSLSHRRVRYTASVTYDGTDAVFTLGIGHGVAAGDTLHPYMQGSAGTRASAFVRIMPHGAVASAAGAATLTVPCAGAPALTETIQVVVGSRWIRVPLGIQGHVAGVTNYVGY